MTSLHLSSICLHHPAQTSPQYSLMGAHLKLESLLSESARSAIARKSARVLCCTGDACVLPSPCLGDWGLSANTACQGVSCSYSKPYSSFSSVRISACRRHTPCEDMKG